MPVKQALNINFSKGIDTKPDPWQLQPGKFLDMQNSVFDKEGQLRKRNGFGSLAALPDTTSKYLTTFNGNLTAVGSNLNVYSAGSETWVNKATINPVDFKSLPMIRNNLNQSYCDAVVAESGLMCAVYAETNPDSSITYKYVVADSVTGQNIIKPTLIPRLGVLTYTPKVFLLGRFFVIVFNDLVSTVYSLRYVAITVANPTIVTAPISISSADLPYSTGSFDGAVANDTLYVAWNTNIGGGRARIVSLSSSLTLSFFTEFNSGKQANLMSVCADSTGNTPIIYAITHETSSNTTNLFWFDSFLNPIDTTDITPSSDAVVNITSSAQNQACTVFMELSKVYTYDGALRTDYIIKSKVSQNGTHIGASIVNRSIGLASKSFILDGSIYFLAIYGGPQSQVNYQPTYFLMDENGLVISRFAYENGGPYYVTGLPNATVKDSTVMIPYLYKDLIQAVNKDTNVPTGTQTAGIYSQTGINLATVTFGFDNLNTSEIGNNLILTGGFLGGYDGYSFTENNFFLYPDYVEATWSATGGSIAAQPDGSTNIDAYYYQVTYEWTDNQGNAFRSAPSIPIAVTTTGTGSAGSIALHVPTLRLTYKTANAVKIVVYRWSVKQQNYFQVTSITAPILNDPTVDQITIVDTLSDASILGNNLIYTTGGVLEDLGPPPASALTLFQTRLFLVDAEDRNLIWYSKQVIESTPIEMNENFTIFVPPTTGAQGSTGPISALSSMDDKLIIFKESASYYVNGSGPDNTGANDQFSDPTYITSSVGCTNQKSIVIVPQGLMFQSDKGIWLLGRDLSTQYIGAPVEKYNEFEVLSALNIPTQNQVRFILENGVTLMYDYYYGQWATFTGADAISATLYQGFHTQINKFGQVFQETPGKYLDGSNPVLMSFKTSWLNLAGIQGYERVYYFYILGNYISPHKLNVQIAYEYNTAPTQSSIISPDNYNAPWGGDQTWGQSTPWGGSATLEQWQVHMQRQTCQSFQISVNEIFDQTYETVAGAGLTMSGVTCMVGIKKGTRPLKASNTVG